MRKLVVSLIIDIHRLVRCHYGMIMMIDDGTPSAPRIFLAFGNKKSDGELGIWNMEPTGI